MKPVFICIAVLLATIICLVNTIPAREITDGIGRQILVPDNPVRVVALAPSITEIIFALGQEKRLVGISRFSDFPAEASLLPQVGSYIQPDLEKIVSLNPDLCIAVKDGNPREIADRLHSLHIPVYAVNPLDLEAVISTIWQIGDLLNAKDHARIIVRDMQTRIDRVREQVVTTGRRPGVFFQIGFAPIVSVGKDTVIHELIQIAGGTNLCAAYSSYPRLSREQVLALSPEILIITTMHRDKSTSQINAEWAAWSMIPAVRNNRITIVDSNIFDRPTPRLVDALEQLVRVIHPELFKDFN
ncbi:MAG: ABC transporter substrate-binding protein [Desulfatirhabdiaceae bacterium]